MSARAEQKSTVLIRLPLEDISVIVSIDKTVYFPGDTVHVSVNWDDTETKVDVTPILTIEGTTLDSVDRNTYIAVIPRNANPGSYSIHLNVLDSRGRRLVYDTECVVEVEEHQEVEQIGRYTRIVPVAGSIDPRTAVTLDREQLRNLYVIFERDSIGDSMGPQYVTIKTTVQLQKGIMAQTFERRVMTFRNHGDSNKDRVMFKRYLMAYGTYAVIHLDELERVQVPLDSLPNWAIIKVSIEPDYTINIGAVDQSNAVTRYFRVKGPTIETGFALGVPKVLYDTQAKDSMEYGKTSAMLRFYYVSRVSGHRFPIGLGIGTFGVNTPIDVGIGRGGFAASIFLDVIELARRLNWNIGGKASVGLELTPFFPIQRRSRLLFDAHVGYSL